MFSFPEYPLLHNATETSFQGRKKILFEFQKTEKRYSNCLNKLLCWTVWRHSVKAIPPPALEWWYRQLHCHQGNLCYHLFRLLSSFTEVSLAQEKLCSTSVYLPNMFSEFPDFLKCQFFCIWSKEQFRKCSVQKHQTRKLLPVFMKPR